MGFELEGLDELLNRIKHMQDGATKQKEILYPAAQFMQREIEKEAKAIDDENDSRNNLLYGKLGDRIRLKWNEEKKTSFIEADVFWGHFVEYGTKYQPARSFMDKTFTSNKNKAEELMMQEAKRMLGIT